MPFPPLVSFLLTLLLLENVPWVNSQKGTCLWVGGDDVGPTNSDGSCTAPGAVGYLGRCCLEDASSSSSSQTSTSATTITTTATSCEQMGMVDVGPSIGEACDGDAVAYSGRCCIQAPTTTPSTTSTSSTTSTTPSTPSTTPTSTTPTTTPSTTPTSTPSTSTPSTSTPSTSTPSSTTTAVTSPSTTAPSLYRKGVYVMKCIDVDPTETCLPKILSCLSNKLRMAYICCGSCYAVFPNFLPKMKTCVDDFQGACTYWGKAKCSQTTKFGQIMMEHCKKTCNNCPT